MEKLVLSIPEQFHDPTEIELDTDLEHTQRWLSELPLVNAEQSAGHLLEWMGRLNRCSVKPKQRGALLHLAQPITEQLAETLRDKCAKAALPLSPRHYRQYKRAQELHAATALGFKILAGDLIAEGEHLGKASALMLGALYGMVHQLSLVLVEAYSVYFPEPPNLWSEINQVYLVAEERGIENQPLSRAEGAAPRTVAMEYKRAVLLALANPYHLMQGEAYTLYRMLSKLAPGCEIEHHRDEHSPTYFFNDMKADAGPRFVPKGKPVDAIEPRFFDLSRLLSALRRRIQELDAGESESARQLSRYERRMQLNMLHRIETGWGRTRERKDAREARLGDVSLAIGLSSVHYFISDETPFTPELDEIKIHTGRSVSAKPSLSLVPMDFEPWHAEEAETRFESGVQQPRTSQFDADDQALDVWEKIYATRVKYQPQGENAELSRSHYHVSSWKQKNASQWGLCLFCQTDCSMPVRVGEIIAFQSDADPDGGWTVGAVRWLHVLGNESVEIGIMILSSSAKAIATRALQGVGQGGEYFRTLLIPDTDLNDQDSRLIVPATIYETATELAINLHDRIVYARLTRHIESTGSYSLFDFSLVEMPNSEAANIQAMRKAF